MTQEGQYIYAIIETDREVNFGPMGIGKEKGDVYTTVHNGIGAVISDSPVIQYPVTRANTMAHQSVMETVMKEYPMLPVRFGTVSEGLDPIRKKLLKERQGELIETLTYMRGKIELGLKAIWKDMQPVFHEIVNQNKEIGRLRDRLLKRRGGAQRDQVRLGEMVKRALENWKEQKGNAILQLLDGLWVEQKLNSHFGDQMIMNAAFLVEKEKEEAFDEAVEKISRKYAGRMSLKYVGPIPPCNFVEIVVQW
ncbi:MAG: GvpL/GvpF family gas vesicle protein [Deltaproteobacteria bacterium]|nr:GvpL/GvpF family gas vesicle protein [Deltaproteobacteria bacterium]